MKHTPTQYVIYLLLDIGTTHYFFAFVAFRRMFDNHITLPTPTKKLDSTKTLHLHQVTNRIQNDT